MNPNLIKEGAMHVIEKWHELVETGNKDIYDEILADDVVFYSPIVHTPQKGKEITKIYLSAAGNVLEIIRKIANPKNHSQILNIQKKLLERTVLV